jgi:hypothetical protein
VSLGSSANRATRTCTAAAFPSSVGSLASVAVIPSTAKPATPTITLFITDLFMLTSMPLFLAVLLLTEQYAAKNQCSQEK